MRQTPRIIAAVGSAHEKSSIFTIPSVPDVGCNYGPTTMDTHLSTVAEWMGWCPLAVEARQQRACDISLSDSRL